VETEQVLREEARDGVQVPEEAQEEVAWEVLGRERVRPESVSAHPAVHERPIRPECPVIRCPARSVERKWSVAEINSGDGMRRR